MSISRVICLCGMGNGGASEVNSTVICRFPDKDGLIVLSGLTVRAEETVVER